MITFSPSIKKKKKNKQSEGRLGYTNQIFLFFPSFFLSGKSYQSGFNQHYTSMKGTAKHHQSIQNPIIQKYILHSPYSSLAMYIRQGKKYKMNHQNGYSYIQFTFLYKWSQSGYTLYHSVYTCYYTGWVNFIQCSLRCLSQSYAMRRTTS